MVTSTMSSRFGEGFRRPSDREDIACFSRGQLGLVTKIVSHKGAGSDPHLEVVCMKPAPHIEILIMGNQGFLEGGEAMKRALYLATVLALLTLFVAAPALAQGAATDQYAAAVAQYAAAGAQYGEGAAILPPTGGLGLLPLAAGLALLLGGLFGGLALRGRLQRR